MIMNSPLPAPTIALQAPVKRCADRVRYVASVPGTHAERFLSLNERDWVAQHKATKFSATQKKQMEKQHPAFVWIAVR